MTVEENLKSLWQYALKFGVIYALSVIIIDLVYFTTGIYRGAHPVIDVVITVGTTILILFYGMKTRRDNDFNGFSKYLEVLKTCLAIGVVASVILALWKFSFYSFINPEELAKEIETAKKAFLDLDIDEDKKMEIIAAISVKSTAMSKLWGQLITTNIATLIFGLILAAFVQKANPDDAYNNLER